MSSELLDILTKEIVDRETKKASEKAERLIFHVQRDSFSIPDIAKTVGVSEDEVRVAKAKCMLESRKTTPDIVSATGLTVAKIKSIHIEMLLYVGISPEEIAKQANACLDKVLEIQTNLQDKGFLDHH